MKTEAFGAGLALGHSAPAALVARLAAAARRARDVMAERRRLAALDQRMLADIGVDPTSRAAECARPFWDVTSRR